MMIKEKTKKKQTPEPDEQRLTEANMAKVR